MFKSSIQMNGAVKAQVIRRNMSVGLSWKLKNTLRWSFLRGWLGWYVFAPLARFFNVATVMGRLEIEVRKSDGRIIRYGTVSYNLVTDAGVAFLVDDWTDNTTDLTTLKYHGCGTGATAEDVGDTALVTESTTALNPDSTRATGTMTQPSANIQQSVGTLTFDGSAAVTEHGLFSQAATGGGTLWDRSVFSAINVASGDSIQFTYQCTVSSGG